MEPSWESPFGTMMPAYYAMHARVHMAKYGTTSEDLALIRVKASRTDNSMKRRFTEKRSLPTCLRIHKTQWPDLWEESPPSRRGLLRQCRRKLLYHCGQQAKASVKPVWILGIGAASAPVNMAGRDLFSGLSAGEIAGKQAYKMAGVTPKDIHVAEVHDCFTIAEMMAYENLGFAKPGEGRELIRSKATYKEESSRECGRRVLEGPSDRSNRRIASRRSCSSSETGNMQVKDPQIGLVHNIGGVLRKRPYFREVILWLRKKRIFDSRYSGSVSFTAITKTNHFVGYLEQGKVMGTKCKGCGLTFFLPKSDCYKCLRTATWNRSK